ncbi:hypothetical protein A6U98_22910 [Rhizobium sp. WYCCWR10014]|nr:hypothetical protein A6U98_22910 [Rhizobium sp. WYCCWR10014]
MTMGETYDANTPIWQVVILPAEPVYCGPTPQDALPRIQPVLRHSSPSESSRNWLAEFATRSSVNSGRIRAFASRNEDAQSSSVASIDTPVIHDLRIMETHGVRHSTHMQL